MTTTTTTTTTLTVIDKTYRIPRRNLDELSKAINYLNNKAQDLDQEPILLEIVSEDREVVEGRVSHYVTVRLKGKAPQIEGWTLAGRINHRREETDIIRTVVGNLPDKYRDRGNICDHCGYNRFRKTTYVLQQLDEDKYLQVGSTCVKDFTGGHDVDKIANYFSKMLDTIESAGKSYGTVNLDDPDYLYYDLETYLAYVVYSSNHKGWVSKSKAVAGQDPTCYRAQALMTSTMHSVSPSDREEARNVIQWGSQLPEVGTNDFLHNVRALCVSGEVHVGDLPYAAAAVMAYDRSQSQSKSKSKRAANGGSQHVSSVGLRRRFVLKVVHKFDFETKFGKVNGFKFEDNEGNAFVWKTKTTQDLRVGQVCKMEATVKDHDTYQGQDQTVLSRCWID